MSEVSAGTPLSVKLVNNITNLIALLESSRAWHASGSWHCADGKLIALLARALQFIDTSDPTLGTSISEASEGVILFQKYFLPPISLSARAEAAQPLRQGPRRTVLQHGGILGLQILFTRASLQKSVRPRRRFCR